MNNFMDIAVKEAQKAFKKGEVPIGAVLVKDGKVIAKSHNKREKKQNALKHAEVNVIDLACKKLKSWRLDECYLYVTLEPCPMCAGAIANARIKKVFIATREKTSKDNLCEQIFKSERLNHKVEFEILQEYSDQCSELLSTFFKQKRKS